MSTPSWTNKPPADTPMRLMSLWGGFNDTASDNSGPEKRLEVDFRLSAETDLKRFLTPLSWTPVLEAIGCENSRSSVENFGLSVTSEQVVMVVNKEKLVLTTCASVELHNALPEVLKLCEASAVEVQWASFMRKNTQSPWLRSADQGMAIEYSVLKAAFPKGNTHLVGPLDSDHYFYFVFDDLHRNTTDAVLEDDVQVNLVMYDVKPVESTDDLRKFAAGALGTTADDEQLNCTVNKRADVAACRLLDGEHFETLRMSSGKLGHVASFETNVPSEAVYREHLERLVSLCQPERFSVVVLLDPFSAPAQEPIEEPLRFDTYSRFNTATTEFEHGYIVKKLNFVRQ